MKKSVKIWLAAGAALILLGALLFAGAMTACGWDFSRLSTVKYETSTYPIQENFRSISINTDTADVLLVPSQDGRCTVVCYEPENIRHMVSVQEDTLTVQVLPQGKWYQSIGIQTGSPKVTVYLPDTAYGRLNVDSDTADVEIPESFAFESMNINTSTGDIITGASASGEITVRTGTGDISAENFSAGSLTLTVSTGKITLSHGDFPGDISVRVSTGKAVLSDVSCGRLVSTGNTGDILLTNVTAAESFFIERTTGDIHFDRCDAAEITVRTDTGDVKGTFLTEKLFTAHTSTGKVEIPETAAGGRCDVTTSTGDIRLQIG